MTFFIGESDLEDEEPATCKTEVLPTTAKLKNKGGRLQNIIWDHFDTVRDQKKVTSNKCKICKNEVSAQAPRMKKHLAKCLKQKTVPEPLKTVPAFLDLPSASPSISVCGEAKQMNMKKFVKIMSQKEKEAIDLHLGRFLFSADISFNIVENEFFQKFLSALNPAYTLPSNVTLGTTILDKVYQEVEDEKSVKLKNATVVLQQDGWSTNHNDPVIAHCISAGGQTHFLSAINTGTNEKNAQYCYQLLQKAKEDAEAKYGCEVVGVVTDNCSTMKSLQELVKTNFPNMEAYGCNAHLKNLLGDKFTPADLKTAVNTVQVYIRGHHATGQALKDLKGLRPVLPGSTRWNSQIDSFINYCQNHSKYLEIVRNLKTKTGSEVTKLAEIKKILQNPLIYEQLEEVIKTLEPICVGLDKVNSVKYSGTGTIRIGTGTK